MCPHNARKVHDTPVERAGESHGTDEAIIRDDPQVDLEDVSGELERRLIERDEWIPPAQRQVKDARFADSVVVPAGEGEGEFRESMRAFAADGFEGFASLEPHLQIGHSLGGFSGPENWRRAHAAFVRVLQEEGIAYE